MSEKQVVNNFFKSRKSVYKELEKRSSNSKRFSLYRIFVHNQRYFRKTASIKNR